ncbi:hypothetical protein [Nostoc sp.]
MTLDSIRATSPREGLATVHNIRLANAKLSSIQNHQPLYPCGQGKSKIV